MREKIILIGGGGYCKSVIDVIECLGTYDIVWIVDKKEK
ncbi:MAG: PglD N-terminal domain [Clostridia bacterium]|nr:PglD N-terminal domain [Clostridia bacterium]